MTLVVSFKKPSGCFELAVVPNAGEDVQNFTLGCAGVSHEFANCGNECRVCPPLVGVDLSCHSSCVYDSVTDRIEDESPNPESGLVQTYAGKIEARLAGTHNAAEMVASIAKQDRLATLVGTRTADEVLGGANFKSPGGYIL